MLSLTQAFLVERCSCFIYPDDECVRANFSYTALPHPRSGQYGRVRKKQIPISEVTRTLPMNPALKALLERLRTQKQPKPSDRICVLSECQGALTRACRLVGCQRLTHHNLRHYFTTKCLQAGVDVLTLAKWLGHRDNGKLLLKVYSHLQSEHSQSMAAKVAFGQVQPENVTMLKGAAI